MSVTQVDLYRAGPQPGKNNYHVVAIGSKNALRTIVGSFTLFYLALPQSGPDQVALVRATYCRPEITKVKCHWNMSLSIHWNIPVTIIHWTSDDPFEHTADK